MRLDAPSRLTIKPTFANWTIKMNSTCGSRFRLPRPDKGVAFATSPTPLEDTERTNQTLCNGWPGQSEACPGFSEGIRLKFPDTVVEDSGRATRVLMRCRPCVVSPSESILFDSLAKSPASLAASLGPNPASLDKTSGLLLRTQKNRTFEIRNRD